MSNARLDLFDFPLLLLLLLIATVNSDNNTKDAQSSMNKVMPGPGPPLLVNGSKGTPAIHEKQGKFAPRSSRFQNIAVLKEFTKSAIAHLFDNPFYII
jgi:hypothetical protein